VENGLPLLEQFFQNFTVIAQSTSTVSGHPAVTIENTADWVAPNGTVVSFHRATLFTENRGNVLIFTATTHPGMFETFRPDFQAIANSITLF
jgi:hypothetical protein